VSQAFHLPRAGGNYKQQGFEVRDAAAVDAPAAADFAPVLDAAADVVAKANLRTSSSSTSRTPPPTRCPGRRRSWRTGWRVAAALYHRKIAPMVVLYNDRYTRGPVNLATR